MPSERSPRAPNPTLEDLKSLLWAVVLIELAVAGLAALTRGYFGPRVALAVGLGIGGLVLVAFALVTVFGLGASLVADLVAWRERRRPEPRGRASRPPGRRD